MNTPLVPISWGELFDKISILEIKVERITSETARANVAHELSMLRRAAETCPGNEKLADLRMALRQVNEELWDIEDAIRRKEHAGAFDAAFIALARSVYQRNDERARIKRAISLALASPLIEEKQYGGADVPHDHTVQ